MWTVSQVAERDQIRKQAVSKSVRQFSRTSSPCAVSPATSVQTTSYVRNFGIRASNKSPFTEISQRSNVNFDQAAHSLRSGFLTSAAANGASIFKMMDVSRHKSIDTLRGYVRDAEMFHDHAGNGLL
jgi:formate dehydrogenase assembly factor FdhD